MVERSMQRHARRVKARPAHGGLTSGLTNGYSSILSAESQYPGYAKPTIKSGNAEIYGTIRPVYDLYPGE